MNISITQLYSIGRTFCECRILVGGFNRISDNRARVLKAQKSAAKRLRDIGEQPTSLFRKSVLYCYIVYLNCFLFNFILKMFAV